MSMINIEIVTTFEEYYGSKGYPYTFNYNIVIKIKNGPVKNFFYKDYSCYKKHEEIKEKLKKFIKNIYEREFEVEIIAIPDIAENKDKYIGKEIIIKNNCFILK